MNAHAPKPTRLATYVVLGAGADTGALMELVGAAAMPVAACAAAGPRCSPVVMQLHKSGCCCPVSVQLSATTHQLGRRE